MKKSDSVPFLAKHKQCTGCMACIDSCPVSALSCTVFNDGHIYPQCDYSKCINCKKCTKVCPILNNYDYNSPVKQSRPYAAWSMDDEIREKSASGGIFASIASYIISIGGCVAGAVMQGIEVKHIIIDKIEDIYLLQGSKYQQGNLSGIYNQVVKRLKKEQIVLFSGTACQIVGLYSSLKCNKKLLSFLYTIDIVCGGFPSFLPMEKFLSKHKGITTIKSFRDKDSGWKSQNYFYSLKVVNNNGIEINYGNKNIVIGAFNSSLTNRSSCLNCCFAIPCRKSDLTVMDFWGDTNFKKEHFKGLSVAVTHTNKGSQLLNRAKIISRPIKWIDFLPFNQRMAYGKKCFLYLHPSHLFYSFFFKHLHYSILSFLYYEKNIKVLSPIYKFILFTLNKINNIYKQYYINKLINKLDNQ